MKAHVEILSAVVRVGDDTDEYGKDFDYSVAVSCTDGKTAVVKALVSDGDFTSGHAKAIIRALKDWIKGFDNVTWQRMK